MSNTKDVQIEIDHRDILNASLAEALIIPYYQDEKKDTSLFHKVDRLLQGRLDKKAKKSEFVGKKGQHMILSTLSFPYEEIIVIGCGKRQECSLAVFQKVLSDGFRVLEKLHIASCALSYYPREVKDPHLYGKYIAEALYLTLYRFDKYRSKDKKKSHSPTRLKKMILSCPQKIYSLAKGIEEGICIAQGISLARDLVNEPASYIHPLSLVEEARKIAHSSQGTIAVQVFDEQKCKQLGMGAFLGVAKGSEHAPQFIVLTYTPKNSSRKKSKTICLVGKSITFDSGGLSLKPSEGMEDMKIDMAGGATVLGVFQTLALKSAQKEYISHIIYGVLPICENMPSGTAMRPGDIVRTLNGKTIEVLNTDAEGRLALADAISYAEVYLKPDYLIDLATLTGAIMISLGTQITGLFSNNSSFADRFVACARQEGEAVWQMPLYEEYKSMMKSKIADLRNISKGRYGGSITAALFLEEFVAEGRPWIHLDIAGASYNAGDPLGLIPHGGTGWGIKTIMSLITQHI